MAFRLPDRLTYGYRSFLEGRFAAERSRYERLAETGQWPDTMVIGCVDSGFLRKSSLTPRRENSWWCETSPIWSRSTTDGAIPAWH